MLQALSDLFLVISSDTKVITNKDLIIFYNFITKKIPQIEQHIPSIIAKSLSTNISSELLEEKQIDINEYKLNKDNNTKKLFIHFQKQIFYLFTELINFCFKQGILKINNKILKEKVLTKFGFNPIKEKNDKNQFQNENNTQEFLIYLVLKEKVSCTLHPTDYIIFFNSENSAKKRIIAERFMKFIKHLIIIFKESKKHYNIKRVLNTEKKVSNTEKIIGLNDNRFTRDKNKFSIQNMKKFMNEDNSISEKSIIVNNGAENSLECDDEINDTKSCNTIKNIENIKEISKNNNIKINNKPTITFQNKNNIMPKSNLKYSQQRNTYNIINKKTDFNIISNNNLGNKNPNNIKSFVENKNIYKNSNINKSQNFVIHGDYNNDNEYDDIAGCNIN